MRLLTLLLFLLGSVAHADSLELPAIGARATARAGAGLLSTDDGTALHYNPANLARRTALRLNLGLAAVRRSVHFASGASFPGTETPRAESASNVSLVPWGGAAVGLGERVVAGAALLVPSETSYRFPAPQTAYDPARDDRGLYPQRYGGERLHLER